MEKLPIIDLEEFLTENIERSLGQESLKRIVFSPMTQEVHIEYDNDVTEFFQLAHYPTYKVRKKRRLLEEVKVPPLVI